ncbi:MAG TPA: DUF2937 family protein [Spirochaetota bacterium]|mgnify:CR=1 FL=1|nr:DUF2937 family protein [Spirochaetota bacterium]
MNRFIKAPFSFLESLLDRIISVTGAIVFAQMPAFIVQYQQRLGGHVDELKHLINKYRSYAASNNRTLDEYINIHLQSTVKEFASTGQLMTENLTRFNELSKALKELADSTGIVKLFMFFKNIDIDIYRGTMKNFVPGITFSTDAILYGIIGVIIFMSIYWLIRKTVTVIISKVKGY